MFYTVPAATPLPQLMNDALILAHATGHDVFNALDIFENEKILKGRPMRWCLVGPLNAADIRSLGPLRIALDIYPLPSVPSTELKFGIGDGKLRYYLFNWRVAQEMPSNKVGLIML